ncbi:PLP-dependent transferase [Geomonas subterranea]|uniref:PLP-dependent transferase n=1 Tax=Geomonas subterranea TaxID=2847989 RepID=A0ABX8LH79_9BACT|nr:PLP-dependent transferase [Geomonas subterranea]QXE91383.1 PLP-dependent transferase [Geomonas subterranea]QXM10530.1 PLP-dependent transferase [Geomonas subterranea]
MNDRNPIAETLQERELGSLLPLSEHAVSVALPKWQDVVGYEEKWPEVVDSLQGGYPRCVIHPGVLELAELLAPGEPCLPFPSLRVAEAAAAFIRAHSGAEARVVRWEGEFGVATTQGGADSLKIFWRYPGQIVSTRRARAALSRASTERLDDRAIRQDLRRQLAGLYDCNEDDVFLHPSGMAALYHALRAVQARRPGAATVQLGFPYSDSLRLLKWFGGEPTLLHDLGEAPACIEEIARLRSVAACCTEIPGNPLLGTADLGAVTPILRRFGIPLIVDDAVGSPFNVDASAHADLIATSLTKFLAGSGDVMGGCVVCNPRSPYYPELKALAAGLHEEHLWVEDAAVLAARISGFAERMRLHNANGLEIARRLREHPAVERVWYPQWSDGAAYEAVRRPDGGWGALVSFLPKDAATAAPQIYDRLPIAKGPSFGTVFTLACPFTLLGHYCELEWAESLGVPRELIRLSVGLEDVEELWRGIAAALGQPGSQREGEGDA